MEFLIQQLKRTIANQQEEIDIYSKDRRYVDKEVEFWNNEYNIAKRETIKVKTCIRCIHSVDSEEFIYKKHGDDPTPICLKCVWCSVYLRYSPENQNRLKNEFVDKFEQQQSITAPEN